MLTTLFSGGTDTTTLTPDTGVYVLSGQSAPLEVKLEPATGAYALSRNGQQFGVELEPATGAYTLTGQSADLSLPVVLEPDTGVYVSIGWGAPTGPQLEPATGVYALGGQSAPLDVKLEPATGAYLLTGQSAGLVEPFLLRPDTGVYALGGQAAPLKIALEPETGAYVLTGKSAELARAWVLTPVTGVYALVGSSQLFKIELEPEPGEYVLFGEDAPLEWVSGSSPTTFLVIRPLSGRALTLATYSARGITQTLDLVAIPGSIAGYRETMNGETVDLSPKRFHKYQSTISCTDVETPCLDGAWKGQLVQVDCALELSHVTGATPRRPAVPGSIRVEGHFTFYRPRLTMRVTAIRNSMKEFADDRAWQIDLRELRAPAS